MDTNTTPMLFNGDMVRALLDGRKTQTRRVCKFPRNYAQIDFVGGRGDWDDPSAWGFEDPDYGHFALKGDGDHIKEIPCPCGQPGDLIWVRETWTPEGNDDGYPVDPLGNICDERYAMVLYRASKRECDGPWRPSIHMPRWASRLTLRITDVRVERVQAISDRDAIAEGVYSYPFQWADPEYPLPDVAYQSTPRSEWRTSSPKDAYRELWDSIYADRGNGWNANPWVWALTFEVIQDNVDHVVTQHDAAKAEGVPA